MSNSRLRDSNLQSAAALWLRHSFARAFSGDSTEAIYLSLREALASWQATVSSIQRRLIATRPNGRSQ